jgi:hypothetical protein
MNDKDKKIFFKNVEVKFTKKKEVILGKFCRLTKYIGRMIEIKCPRRRKILMDPNAPEVYGVHGEPITNLLKDVKKGVCPAYYWVQVQLQLFCCDLDECDFWQTEIWEYEDPEDFVDDTDPEHPWISKTSKQEKGAVIQIMPLDKIADTESDLTYNDKVYNYAEFIYQPRVDMSPQEIDLWLLETISNIKWTHKGMVFDCVKYYKLIQSRNITIKRDDKWIQDTLPKFEKMWGYVAFFRANKDKTKLLKLYLQTFKTDYYGKIKETYKGEVMETIAKIFSVPNEKATDKEHRKYARFIQELEELIADQGIIDEEEVIEDIKEDVKEIQEALQYTSDSDDDIDNDEKIKIKRKHVEFVKKIKKQVDVYLFEN